jgi:hypothetical protein
MMVANVEEAARWFQLVSRLRGVHGSRGHIQARCPAHGDTHPSLSVRQATDGRILVHCFAGCSARDVVTALGLTLADLMPPRQLALPALTVASLAMAKGLPVAALRGYGVHDRPDGSVGIPYRDDAGTVVAVKRRTAAVAKEGSWWPKGRPLLAYGLDRLALQAATGPVTLVEGESDCWALWLHEIPAVGLPGAQSAKTITAEWVQALSALAVVQEPDAGGAAFVAGVQQQLARLGWAGTVAVIRMPPGIKDPLALYQRDPAHFAAAWAALLAQAQPVALTSAEDAEAGGPPTLVLVPLADEGAVAPATGLPDQVWRDGWFRDFRDWVAPSTDGAWETVFAGAAILLGLAVGRRRAVSYGRLLYPNLFALVVGPSGRVRKSTVLSRVQAVIQAAFGDEDAIRVSYSLGSAEGLLERFCDDTGTALTARPGQRVLVSESEFTNILTKMDRTGTANLGDVLMTLYDGDDVTPQTRTRSISVRAPFLSVLTATTPENLAGRLDARVIESGLLPRFAVFWATPRPALARPPAPDAAGLEALATYLRAVATAQASGPVVLDLEPAAEDLWRGLYADYHAREDAAQGTAARLWARIPEQVLRFALLYALAAQHPAITVDDLALAGDVGAYLTATAGAVPQLTGRTALTDMEQRILRALARSQDWVPASAIHRLVSGRISAPQLRQMLDALELLGLVEHQSATHARHPAFPVYRAAGDPLSHGHTVVQP